MSAIQSPETLTFYLYHLENGPILRVDSTPPRKVAFESTPTLKNTPGLFDRLVALADSDTLNKLKNVHTPPGMDEYLKACSLMIPPEHLPKDSTPSENHIYNSELALSILIISEKAFQYKPTQYLLSFLYLNGIGIEQNILYSTSLIKYTCNDFPPAKYALAYGLLLGVHGFEKKESMGKAILLSCHSEKSQTALEILAKKLPLESLPFPYPQPLLERKVTEGAPHSPEERSLYQQLLTKMEGMEKDLQAIKAQNALLLGLLRNMERYDDQAQDQELGNSGNIPTQH